LSRSTPPLPPRDLAHGGVRLDYRSILPGQPEFGIVPSYHFRILRPDGVDCGYLNVRIGHSDHVRLYAGHIAYAVDPQHRGQGLAGLACRAVARFVRTLYPEAILTTDPGNLASQRTIEKLGAEYLGTFEVPPHDPSYLGGSRWKLRYVWRP
jgi:predicted acetyltransferase